MLKQFVMAFLVLMLASVLGPASTASAPTPNEHTRTYTFDVPPSLALMTDTATERGPPRVHGLVTTYDAIDHRSCGASACSGGSAVPAISAYAASAVHVQVVNASATTGGHVGVADGDLLSLQRAHVAAKAGREIPFGPASEDAWSVLNRVDGKGAPLPGYKGGKTFLNDGSQGAARLPEGPTYREWDLSPNVKGVPRDARRLVTGSDGSAFYTTDHYLSFIQFR